MMTSLAKNLKEGSVFKTHFEARKLLTVKRIITLPTEGSLPDEHKGKLLIVLDDCKQFVMDPEKPILIRNA